MEWEDTDEEGESSEKAEDVEVEVEIVEGE